jgi:heme exporter protein D
VNNLLKLPMKGVVDFFLGLAVLIVGVVLLFLAFLSVRNEQSLLVEAVRQSRDTARLASAQDVGNTSVIQCRQTNDPAADNLENVARALYNAASQIWGSEGLVVALGVLGDPSWTLFCGDNECRDPQEITPQITQCFERFGQTNDECFGYFVAGPFGNVCGRFENNNFVTGEGGDNPPQDPECYVHDDCQPTEYCYDYTCYDCPDGYKRRGVTVGQGAFWFLRNFRLASIFKLFFSLLQADFSTELPGGTEGSDDHPFCEPCSSEEMHHCDRSGGGSNGQGSNSNQSVENPD